MPDRTSLNLGQRARGRAPLWARATLVTLLFATLLGGAGGAHPRAATAAAVGSSSRFGLVTDIGTRYGIYNDQGRPIDVLAQTGAKWVKEEFRWDWVEPRRGVWEWAFMDEAVDKERAKGLDILGLLDYTAGWAVNAPGPVSNTAPPLELWSEYVTQTVSRYKDRVHAWEVWNEPNEGVFWAGTKEQYAQLLAVTYDIIKRIDPSATVVGPAITGVDEAWLDAVDWSKFDVLGLHLYVPATFLNDQEYSFWNQGLPNFKDVVARHGGKPVWVTEFGYSASNGQQGWYVGNEGNQARYIVQWLAETLAYPGLNIEKVFMYDFNDDTNSGGFGLTRNDWVSRKPAFDAYRTAAERLDFAQPRGRFDAGPGNFGFRLTRDGKLIDVVWALSSGTAVIPTASDGEVYDLRGNRSVATNDGGYLRIPVTADPVYVIHQETGATAGTGPPSSVPGAGSYLFAQTGNTVNGIFLDFWNTRGGLNIFGLPLTGPVQERLEDGQVYTVQYFERARLEYHPANDVANQVQLGQFGRRIHPADPPAQRQPGAEYFEQTGHNLGGGFRDYWYAQGGLPLFGYPISEEYMETLEDGKPYIVQYFERARFEYHPDNPEPFKVELGQFGRRILSGAP